MRSVVVHGHFYQPPREEPRLELLEREPSAAPYHDWNQRIDHECYAAVAAARLPVAPDGASRQTNLYRALSFDFGPTLLSWLEREARHTYEAVLDGDAESARRLGHGNAIATTYHHIILPLASRRDKVTEVRWGVRDFRRRFGRDPEGFWLPETAVDEETLEVVAEEGLAFTILAPHQLAPLPERGLPAWVRTGNGGRLAVFAYDGPIAHGVAFGPLIRDAGPWSREMLAGAVPSGAVRLVSLATDGETYGHHHKFGEMALGAMLERVRAAGVAVENYASFLARHPPVTTARLAAPSSWSCVHGVERWRSDCGCRLEPDTQQQWRAPLRGALEWLRDQAAARFERESAATGLDPWAERNRYDPTLPPPHPASAGAPPAAGASGPGHGAPADSEAAAAAPGGAATAPGWQRLELLEQQEQALRMFTSCGWFFDDPAGLETRVCLRHAARVIELAGAEEQRWRDGLLERLALAPCNDPEDGSVADLFREGIESPHRADALAAAAVAVIAGHGGRAPGHVGAFEVLAAEDDRVAVRDRRTGRRSEFQVAGLPSATDPVRLHRAGETLAIPLTQLPEPARVALEHGPAGPKDALA